MKFLINATSMPFKYCKDLLGMYPVLKKYNLIIGYEYAYITINTIEELVQLSKDVKHELIINDDCIEIYDDYRE